MIQFNLLPSVKLEYVKAKRAKRLTILISGLIAGVALLALVLLFANVQLQAKHSRDLSQDIRSESNKLEGTEDISSILTIQNQLNSLSSLHANKPAAARLFNYIRQTTPATVVISNMEVDFEASTIVVRGKTPGISLVNAYVDTLKFTTFKTPEDIQVNAFKDVVLSAIATDSADGSATYELTFTYDPAIFSNSSAVTLTVPRKATTRSELDKPDSVFQPQENQ